MKTFIASAALLYCASAGASELMLFDIPLRTASRHEIHSAILAVGGKQTSTAKDTEQYDVGAIGLPGATRLEAVYLEDRIVFVQYQVSRSNSADERLRKMLVQKYGQPGGGYGSFDAQYAGDGIYTWKFDGGMELVYKQPFSGYPVLTYVNRQAQARLEELVRSQDKRNVQRDAAAKSNLF